LESDAAALAFGGTLNAPPALPSVVPMRLAVLVALSLLAVAAPVAMPVAAASPCTPMLDAARACVNPADASCLISVKLGGDYVCLG
jgi:hypothetical protein